MRKFAHRLKLKAKDACRDAGAGLLKAALCLTAVAGSAVAAWAAPTSLTMYEQQTGGKEPIVYTMNKQGENTFTVDFVCSGTPVTWGKPMDHLIIKDENGKTWDATQPNLAINQEYSFKQNYDNAPVYIESPTVGSSYTVTITFPNGGDQGSIIVTPAAEKPTTPTEPDPTDPTDPTEPDPTAQESITMYVESAQGSNVNNPADVFTMTPIADNKYTADFVCKSTPYGWVNAAGIVLVDSNKDGQNEPKYLSAGEVELDKTANLVWQWGTNATLFKNAEVGTTYTVTVELPAAGNQGTITVTRAAVQQELEFEHNIKSAALRLTTTVNGSRFYRDVEIPYNAETREFAGDFLLSNQDEISVVVNEDKQTYKAANNGQNTEYKVPDGKFRFVTDDGSQIVKAGSNGEIPNQGWRHVVLKEQIDHSLTVVFSEGEFTPESLADATLKVVKPDGTVKDVPMVANGLSWSAKDVHLEVGDKPYIQFADGVYVKYPSADYVFETKKPDNKSVPMAQMAERPVNMSEFPAVTKAGQFTFTFYYVLNDNAIYAPLYLSRKIVTLEDPEMSVWRDGKGGEPEFISLMDFVLLEKIADAVVDLKAGETIFLKYGEEEIPVELANAEAFEGEHALSDAATESTRLTVPADGTYRLRLDMNNGRKLVVEPRTMPEKLWYIPCGFASVSEAALNGKIALLPAKDERGKVVPGKYVSEKEIALDVDFFITDSVDKFYTVDSEGNTIMQNVGGQPDYALGGCYNSNAVRTKFEPGKSVLMLEWRPNTNKNVSSFRAADDVLAANEKHLMYVDIATEANKTLKWGNVKDYKGKEFYLIGGDGKQGILTDGTVVDPVPGAVGNPKYKFIYHPTTNLYTLTLDEVWGGLAIDTKPDANGNVESGRYTAIKNNELINTVGHSYDLYYGYTDEGEGRYTKPYTDDEGNVLADENWNYFVINDPACADDMVKLPDSGQVAYNYYKDITIVFDPDNNRLWMQSPNKDFEYDPTKDPVDITQPLYIVFCAKVSASDKQDAYRVVKVRPMVQSKRVEMPFPEHKLDELVDGKPADGKYESAAKAKRRAAKRNAAAAADDGKGSTYGYYTTGDFGSYKFNEIDGSDPGWCHPETWSLDDFSKIFVEPQGVQSSTGDNDYMGLDYRMAYIFFSETDGEDCKNPDGTYNLNEMLKRAVHLHVNQEAVLENNTAFQVGDGGVNNPILVEKADQGGLLPGSPNEMAARFFNQDFASGVEATRQILDEQHEAGGTTCSEDHFSMHLLATDCSEPFYVELDRSGSQATTRITRVSNTIYFVILYRQADGSMKHFEYEMYRPDPEYPYYYETKDFLPLRDYTWKTPSEPRSYDYCNIFFSVKGGEAPQDVICRSLNASGILTPTAPDATEEEKEAVYDGDTMVYVDYNRKNADGLCESTLQTVGHNFPRTFYNTNYVLGSGKMLNYIRLRPYDVNDPDDEKEYKVCYWLKGSTKQLPDEVPMPDFVEQPVKADKAPQRAAERAVKPLEKSTVQFLSRSRGLITGVDDVVEEQKPQVMVEGRFITVKGGEKVIISDTQGRVMYTGAPCTSLEVAHTGIYIVNVDGDATKVIVR